MGILDWILGTGSANKAPREASKDDTIEPPHWVPDTPEARRLSTYGVKVARELRSENFPFSRPGTNYWVVSYDVREAIWYPAAPGSWSHKNGRVRDGWSQGACLILFGEGQLAQGEWYGEVDVRGTSIGVDSVTNPKWPESRWSAGNFGRWRQGGGGLNPEARENFKGRWPDRDKKVPLWAGTSAQLKRLLEQRRSQVPRYF